MKNFEKKYREYMDVPKDEYLNMKKEMLEIAGGILGVEALFFSIYLVMCFFL